MTGMFLTSLRGTQGQVTIPSLGAVIGTIEPPKGYWTLRRREDRPPSEGVFRLHAVFSYLNPDLWDAPFGREIYVTLARGKQYRLDVVENERTVLEGRSLLIEGVTLWPVES